MRTFNETKMYELNPETLDYEKGYLKPDKLVIAHHEATPFIKGKTAQQIAQELELQGIVIEKGYGDMLYRVIKEYESGGRETQLIEDEPDTTAKEAYDEYEDIQVYVPYTEAELAERKLEQLRMRRERECFPYINRGSLWYESLTDEQLEEFKEWYVAWLNVTETLTVPDKPQWLVQMEVV